MKRTIFVPDIHAPAHDKRAFAACLSAIRNVKPDRIVLLGDVGEFEGASGWKWEKRKRPPLEYILPEVDNDFKATNKILDDIDSAIDWECEKIFIEGNHEDRVNRLIEEHPYLSEKYKLQTALKLDERRYAFYPLGKLVKVGPVYAYHGIHAGGVMHSRAHLMKYGCNIVYGHYHDVSCYSMQRDGDIIKAWCLGCLKDLSADANSWLMGLPTNWSHSIGLMTEWSKNPKSFTMDVIEIKNGFCSLGAG